MRRRSAVSGSWYRTGSSLYSSSEPSTLPVFGFTRYAWGARKAPDLKVSEVIVFGAHPSRKPGHCRVLCETAFRENDIDEIILPNLAATLEGPEGSQPRLVSTK